VRVQPPVRAVLLAKDAVRAAAVRR